MGVYGIVVDQMGLDQVAVTNPRCWLVSAVTHADWVLFFKNPETVQYRAKSKRAEEKCPLTVHRP